MRPAAPTNLQPPTGTETSGTALCNMACGNDYDCGAYRIELKRGGDIVHFDGIREDGTVVDDRNSRFSYKEYWPRDGDDDAISGDGRWSQTAGAKITFGTIFRTLRIYTGRDDDGGNLQVYADGVLKYTENQRCSGEDCGNHLWGTSFNVSLASSNRQYVCHNSQCRLNSAKNSATCQDDGTRVVKLTWDKVSFYNTYYIEVYPNSNRSCADPNAKCLQVTGTSYTFYPPSGVSEFAWRVRAINNECGGTSEVAGTWAPRQTFTVTSSISGGFYLDPNGSASLVGGNCQLNGATSTALPSNGSISAVDQTGATKTGTFSNGRRSYNVNVEPWSGATANNVITLNPGSVAEGNYVCSCPVGCQYSGKVSPLTGLNFFLQAPTVASEGWWQTTNGHIYAGGSSGASVQSQIPVTTCTEASGCNPFISQRDATDTEQSAGVIITGGGEVDSQDTDGTQTASATDRGTTPTIASGNNVSYIKERYANFYKMFEMPTDTTNADDYANTADDAIQPTVAPLADKAAYFHQGNLTIRSAWNVQAADSVNSIVVFVDGDLIIEDPNGVGNLITVEPGAFLAFIVSGDIIIDDTVGNSTLSSTSTNIEGIYIADGTITLSAAGAANGGDKRFVGAGSFIGWSGVELNRDFASDSDSARDENNNTIPVESFVFRPDLVKNVPEKMTTTQYVWQETN